MTHLKITQGNNIADTEDVSKELIQKLYELAVSGTLDQTSDLNGRLHLTVGYRIPIEYLNQHYQNKLIVTADNYIIPFEDTNVITYLNSIGIGNNGMVTEAQAAAATVVANSQNTTITSFNELKYFTSITESSGGWDGSGSGNARFKQWTALTKVDISNFTSIGHALNDTDDCFRECTSLVTVKASNKLNKIGKNAFSGCSSLQSITGLSNVTVIGYRAFALCANLVSLTSSNNQPFNLNQVQYLDSEAFNACTSLDFGVQYIPSWTELTKNSNSVKINAEGNTYLDAPISVFSGCTFKQVYVPNLIHTSATSTFRNYYTAGSLFGGNGNNSSVYYQVLYFKDIQYFYPGEFNNVTCSAIVINNTTVPTFRNTQNFSDSYSSLQQEQQKEKNFDRWNTDNKIYVPDSAVNDYKTAAIWSKVASYIYPMSNLQQYATEEDWVAAGKPVALIQEYMS